jgi:Ca-activated chloride channel family protein
MKKSRILPMIAWVSLWLGLGSGQDINQKSIRVEVEMVSLPVSVTTRGGKLVTGLEKEDFQVFEDKVQQKIEAFTATEEPFSVALLLDTSGSTELQLDRIQQEAIRFINLLKPEDSVAIVSFAEDVTLLQDFTTNRTRAAAAIRKTRSGGYTVLYEATWLAFKEVIPSARQRSAVVLLTDGVDTASEKATKAETRELAKESKAPVYCIYFNTQADMQGSPRSRIPGQTYPPVTGQPPVTRPIPGVGSSTEDYMGGRQYLAELADYSGGTVLEALRMEDLTPAYEAIARELSSQYSIGYYPTNPRHEGKYRKVEVKVTKPGLYVQTRKGYYEPDSSRKKR